MYATPIFSALGILGLLVVGITFKAMYLSVSGFHTGARRVLSMPIAVVGFLVGLLFAGLALSYVLTKKWPVLPHFLLLACLCGVSMYFQLKSAKKLVASVAQSASANVEPTVDPVTEATPAVASASAEQTASAASVAAVSAVAATTIAAAAAASSPDDSSLPDVPPPAIISAVSDADLDSWTPDDEDVSTTVAQSANVEPAVAPEVVDAAPGSEPEPQSVIEMPAAADIEELAAVQPEAPAAAVPSLSDETADVLDLNGVVKVSDVSDAVTAEHRVDVVAPASNTEAARTSVVSTSDISAAVA